MPTIAGLRRRGYTPASIREFCLRIGVTKQENMVEMGMLEACIREDLNENAPRAMAVLDPVKVIIENYDADTTETLSVANHPNKEEMGRRDVPFTREIFIEREDFKEQANNKFKRLVLDKEVRLRGAYVIKANRVEKDDNGEITTIYCTYDNETLGKNPSDGRKVKGVIHWVSASESITAEVRLYDRLFNVPNPAAADEFETTLNPESLVVLTNAKLEPSLANSQAEQGFQFERTGYFSRDSKSENVVFNQTVGLRDSWSKTQ
jgi:glutaminyl-tRNA synthetase